MNLIGKQRSCFYGHSSMVKKNNKWDVCNFQQNNHNYVDLEIFSVTCSLYSLIVGSASRITPMFLNLRGRKIHFQNQHLLLDEKGHTEPRGSGKIFLSFLGTPNPPRAGKGGQLLLLVFLLSPFTEYLWSAWYRLGTCLVAGFRAMNKAKVMALWT